MIAPSVSDTRATTHDEGRNRYDEEHDKQDLGDASRTGRDAAESEYGCYQRNDEEDYGIVKHGKSPGSGVQLHNH
jgi:hypothetical protein